MSVSVALEWAADRAVNPVVGVLLIVAAAVLCSAAVGTVLIGFGSDVGEQTTPQATVEIETHVQDETDGFVTLVVDAMPRAEFVTITATTTDGTATLADGTAERTERRDSVDEPITVRKHVDPDRPRDVSVRLVAVAHRDGATQRVFDRTVVL